MAQEYEKRGGDYEKDPKSKNKPKKGAPEPQQEVSTELSKPGQLCGKWLSKANKSPCRGALAVALLNDVHTLATRKSEEHNCTLWWHLD